MPKRTMPLAMSGAFMVREIGLICWVELNRGKHPFNPQANLRHDKGLGIHLGQSFIKEIRRLAGEKKFGVGDLSGEIDLRTGQGFIVRTNLGQVEVKPVF